MGKWMRFVVLASTLMSLLAVLSPTAGAVIWHNVGDAAFTTTGGAGTWSSTAITLGCTGSSTTGTVPATPFVGAVLAISGTMRFSGCTLTQPIGLDCGYTFTASTEPSAGIISGNFDITCGAYLAGFKICHFGGAVPGHYVNPSGATAGKLQMTTSGTLLTSNGPTGSCPLGNGDRLHVTPLTFNVSDSTQPLGPVIIRTA